jgi:hypothetical protein
MSLRDDGFRFVRRFLWVAPQLVQQGDLDCTDMADAEFERCATSAPASLGPMTDAESNLWHHGYACGQADAWGSP